MLPGTTAKQMRDMIQGTYEPTLSLRHWNHDAEILVLLKLWSSTSRNPSLCTWARMIRDSLKALGTYLPNLEMQVGTISTCPEHALVDAEAMRSRTKEG
jgi:hypothetical protein